MASKARPKMKQSVAKLRGVARERAVFTSELVGRNYAPEAAEFVALAVYPLEDDIETTAALNKEINSVAMDVSALVETANTGAAVNAAAMAFHAYRALAVEHDNAAYIARFDETIVGMARLEERFGA